MHLPIARLGALSVLLAGAFGAPSALAVPTLAWSTVVNNATLAPDGAGARFFSYNQPSVNDDGLVVFRGRARLPAGTGSGGGGGGEPVRGIFSRDMSMAGSPLVTVASNRAPNDTVPAPNNLNATFTEFPAFPRIDARSSTIAFRGQSSPVLEYETAPGVTTRGGTSGVYTNPGGTLLTGASQLGNVTNPDLSHFQVPGAPAGTRFDQFPGAPTVTGNTVVFKGNWTDPVAGGQTGIYYRDTVAGGGTAPIQRIAGSGDSFDRDGQGSLATFGSTAPPSASDGRVVFTGLDNEAAPTAGGIFMSSLSDSLHSLTALVRIGVTAVGAGISATFNAIGEALSFDGRHVGFWGAWGSEKQAVSVSCPTDGNAALLAACRSQDNSGIAGDGNYTFDVPLNQGIFLVDVETGALQMKARTGADFADFLFWTFSGAPETAGDADADQEEPRWRSSAFVAVDDEHAVFKGLADRDTGRVGLYGDLGDGLGTLLETGMDGSAVDSAASGMQITSLGIERDGFRNGWLAINVGMANEEESWAGVYVTHVPEPGTLALLAGALGMLALQGRRRRAA